MNKKKIQTLIESPRATHDDIWEKISHILKNKIPNQFYNAFFNDLLPFFEDDLTMVLTAEDEKIVSHIKKCYKNIISETAHAVKPDLKVKFQKKNEVLQKQKKKISEGAVIQPDLFGESNFITANVAPKKSFKSSKTLRQAELKIEFGNKIELNPAYTFERFISGPSNEHALAAARAAAENPAGFNNPLYLYGGVGRGKTHLMMAIGNSIQQQFSWLRVVYTPSETLQNDLVEAFKTNRLPSFNTKYRNLDVLLLDDIQFISQNAVQTQEAIFNIFNYLYQNGKRIVICGDCPPQQLSMLTDRLKSRFQSGLIVDIKEPNLETRLAILKAKSEEMQLSIPFEVLKYMAASLPRQIRVLEAALIKLKFITDLDKTPIDKGLVKSLLADISKQTIHADIHLDDIIRVVSSKFEVAENDILSSSRVANIVLARQICMTIARKYIPRLSLVMIARHFGKSDHTTVLNAEKKVKENIDRNPDFLRRYQEILENLIG